MNDCLSSTFSPVMPNLAANSSAFLLEKRVWKRKQASYSMVWRNFLFAGDWIFTEPVHSRRKLRWVTEWQRIENSWKGLENAWKQKKENRSLTLKLCQKKKK